MATYVLSDCHGRFDKFKKMLNLISFSPNDVLYILGDVIDRNANGLDILLYIMEQKNIHFIIGNHEDMFYRTVSNNHLHFNQKTNSFLMDNDDIKLWLHNNNGGEITARDFISRDKETQEKIIDFLKNSDIVVPNVSVNNNNFYLVHAFPDEDIESVKYIDNIYTWSGYELLWEKLYKLQRDLPMSMILENYFPKDKIVIFGHIITAKLHWYIGHDFDETMPKQKIFKYYDEDNKLRLIGIDCGCAIADDNIATLSCLRLDDFKEFYI